MFRGYSQSLHVAFCLYQCIMRDSRDRCLPLVPRANVQPTGAQVYKATSHKHVSSKPALYVSWFQTTFETKSRVFVLARASSTRRSGTSSQWERRRGVAAQQRGGAPGRTQSTPSDGDEVAAAAAAVDRQRSYSPVLRIWRFASVGRQTGDRANRAGLVRWRFLRLTLLSSLRPTQISQIHAFLYYMPSNLIG